MFRFYLGLPSGRSDVPVHEDLQDDVASHRLNGVFFIGDNNEAMNWIEEQDIAVVNFAGDGNHKVVINYPDIITQSIEALAKAGCHRIGLMSPFHYIMRDEQRRPASFASQFEREVKAKGLAFCSSLVWDASNIEGIGNQTYQEQGFEAAWKFFGPDNSTHPDGLIIIDDMMTRGVLVSLQKMGVELGRDLQIASHTNRGSAVLQGHEHDLIQLQVDPAELVQAMFEMLASLMEHPKGKTPLVQIKAHLIAS